MVLSLQHCPRPGLASPHLVGNALHVWWGLIPDAGETSENLNTAQATECHGVKVAECGRGHILNAPQVFWPQTAAEEVSPRISRMRPLHLHLAWLKVRAHVLFGGRRRARGRGALEHRGVLVTVHECPPQGERSQLVSSVGRVAHTLPRALTTHPLPRVTLTSVVEISQGAHTVTRGPARWGFLKFVLLF